MLKYIQHSVIAVIMQIVIGIVSGNWWAGAAAGSFYFVGREYAQAEYRNIEQNYEGSRANMPWYGGMELRAWTLKGVTDFVFPAIVVAIIAVMAKKITG
jgi:hypothetical protein